MRRKELVEPTGTYWGDEPVHRFHHVLIRDAAYRRLLKTTRADLHEKVAVWTDTAAAHLIGEHEAVIAFHYEQAYRYRAELGTLDDHATESRAPRRRAAGDGRRSCPRPRRPRRGRRTRAAARSRSSPTPTRRAHRPVADRVRMHARVGRRRRRATGRRPTARRGRRRSGARRVGFVLRGPTHRAHRSRRTRGRRGDRDRRGEGDGGARRRSRRSQGPPGAGRAARALGSGRRRGVGARPRARRGPARRRPPPGHRGARRRTQRGAVGSEPGRACGWPLPRRRSAPSHHDRVAVGRGHVDAVPGRARSVARPVRRRPLDARVVARDRSKSSGCATACSRPRT